MPERVEYYLFRLQSKAIKNFLQETCYLSRYPKDKNVFVAYLTPPKAFAKIIVPIINGATARPTIAFHLSGYEFATGENHLGWVRENIVSGDSSVVYRVEAPEIYRLTYSLQIYTRIPSDMDILLYQIMTAASPRAKAIEFIEDQWVEIRSGNPTDETTLEPGDAQDRIIRFGLDLTIPRAYLPRGRKEYEPITSFDLDDFEIYSDEDEYLENIGDTAFREKNIMS